MYLYMLYNRLIHKELCPTICCTLCSICILHTRSVCVHARSLPCGCRTAALQAVSWGLVFAPKVSCLPYAFSVACSCSSRSSPFLL